ncbi:MAG: uroporphyrinogen decarboxylase family protein [Candidatus Methanomethyliaceae archaeon]
MTSKERVQMAVNFEEPDRVPIQASFTPEVEERLSRLHGNLRGFDLDVELGHDILIPAYGMGTSYYREGDEYVTEWGIRWKRFPYKTRFGVGYYTEIVEHPLADDAAIDRYVPPDPYKVDMSDAEELMQKYGKTHYIMGDIVCSILEALRYLRGWEQSLIDLVQNPDLAWKIMDMSIEYHLVLGKKLIQLGVDAIWLADDLGGEHDLMMSPETFRRVVKPKMAYMIGELKKAGPQIKIAFHSDGCIYKILDDLVEVGVDILNPVQPEAMDPAWIKKRYGKKLVLWGTIGTQSVLPFGTVEEVRKAVREAIKNLAPGGGLLLAPTHNIQLDTPLENIEAFYQAAMEYGKYPISL